MEATMAGTEDRISDIPDEILHQILSYLPMKAAAQTTVLSRRWKHIGNSYPVFEFCQSSLFGLCSHEGMGWALDDLSTRQEQPRYWEALEKLTNMVDQKLQKFSEYKIGIQKFQLSITLVDQNFDSIVDNWMQVVSEKHVKELDLLILVAGNRRYVLPQTIFAAKTLTVLNIYGYNLGFPVMESAVDLPSLRFLSLKNVYVDEKTTQNLISSCPVVEDLWLCFRANSLERLSVYGLVKLVNLKIKMSNRYSNSEYLQMKLSGCQGLQRVSLRRVVLDCVFDDANFPQIEFISLSRVFFREGSKICSHQVKALAIKYCWEVEKLNIFAPNLISVFHECDYPPRFRFLPYLNDHCELKVKIHALGDKFRTPWYIMLEEYLQEQKQIKTLVVSFDSWKLIEVEFDKEEAEESDCLWPPHALKCLAFDRDSARFINYAAMMDGLFWCCRPQVLSSATHLRDFVKFLFEMLKDREDEGCCGTSEIKCWKHSLKVSDVVVEHGAGIQEKIPLCWDAFQKAVPELRTWKSVHFHLTWLLGVYGSEDVSTCT